MMDDRKEEKRCFTYLCDRYPVCRRAFGSCCAVEMPEDDMIIQPSECYELEDRPLFIEKPRPKRYG